MRQNSKRLKCLLLLLIVVTMLFPKTNVSALTQKQKALNAYKQFLAKSKVTVVKSGKTCYSNWHPYTYSGTKASEVFFGLAYIDNNSIPELVVKTTSPYGRRIAAIFTYRNGKIKRVMGINNNYAQIDGYYYKAGCYKWTQLDEGGYSEEYYSPLKNGKTSRKLLKDCYTDYYYNKTYTDYYKDIKSDGMYVKKTKITKATFNKMRKSLTKSKKMSKVKYYKNTASNRKKHLK